MSLAVVLLFWVAFCFLHSALIAVSTTRFLRRALGERYRWFRLTYNLFSVVTLGLVLMATAKVPGEPVFAWSGWWRIPQILFLALGIFCFVVGGRGYNLREFLGIDPFFHRSAVTEKPEKTLILATGLNALIRHPWYSGVFLLLWSGDLTTTGLAVNGVLSIYVVIGTILEERKLVLEFGQAYRDYQQQVSMFVPWLWLKKSLMQRTNQPLSR